MKILIVNYYKFPMTGAHAYRWSQIAEHWVGKGWTVDYICSTQSEGGLVDSAEHNSSSKLISESLKKPKAPGFFKIRAVVSGWARKAYRKIFWPDGLWHWFPSAFLAMLNKRDRHYDAVVSYTPTFSAHLAVLLFRKVSKQNFFWIADYGDPFSLSDSMPPNNFSIYRHLNRFAERSVIDACNRIVFTNKETKEAYEDKYFCKNKSRTIPHLVDVKSFYSGAVRRKDDAIISVVYVGGLHQGIREPYLAVAVISRLAEALRSRGKKLKVDFYGPVNGIDVSSLDCSLITWHGAVDRGHAISVMKNADILLNIENINCMMTPSKIVEYVATGKPILNIVEQNKTALLHQYEKKGYCCSVDRLDEVENAVDFVSNTAGSVADYKLVTEFLEVYTLINISGKYAELFLNRKFCDIKRGFFL